MKGVAPDQVFQVSDFGRDLCPGSDEAGRGISQAREEMRAVFAFDHVQGVEHFADLGADGDRVINPELGFAFAQGGAGQINQRASAQEKKGQPGRNDRLGPQREIRPELYQRSRRTGWHAVLISRFDQQDRKNF